MTTDPRARLEERRLWRLPGKKIGPDDPTAGGAMRPAG
jgi:hypothetical protein